MATSQRKLSAEGEWPLSDEHFTVLQFRNGRQLPEAVDFELHGQRWTKADPVPFDNRKSTRKRRENPGSDKKRFSAAAISRPQRCPANAEQQYPNMIRRISTDIREVQVPSDNRGAILQCVFGDLFIRRRRQTNIASEFHLMPEALHTSMTARGRLASIRKRMPS